MYVAGGYAVKSFKNIFLLLFLNSRPVIAYCNHKAVVSAGCRDLYYRIIARVFKRIINQVVNNIGKMKFIGNKHRFSIT